MPNVLPTIHIVDDDQSFRAGVANLLGACSYGVKQYASAEQLLREPPIGEFGCILLDLRMPGLSGLELQDRLALLGCTVPVIFVSGRRDIAATVKSIKAGAEDFLTKPISKERLLASIEAALARHKEALEKNARIAGLRSLHSALTPRETEVFALLVRGKPHKQIAHVLGNSERTVKMHRHNLIGKFKVRSLAELTMIAERLGLLSSNGVSQSDG
jgi:FixJ family two-component response regulator